MAERKDGGVYEPLDNRARLPTMKRAAATSIDEEYKLHRPKPAVPSLSDTKRRKLRVDGAEEKEIEDEKEEAEIIHVRPTTASVSSMRYQLSEKTTRAAPSQAVLSHVLKSDSSRWKDTDGRVYTKDKRLVTAWLTAQSESIPDEERTHEAIYVYRLPPNKVETRAKKLMVGDYIQERLADGTAGRRFSVRGRGMSDPRPRSRGTGWVRLKEVQPRVSRARS